MFGVNPAACVQVALVKIPRAGRGRGACHRTPTAIGIGRINPSAPVQVASVIILAARLGVGPAYVPRQRDHSYSQRGQEPEDPKRMIICPVVRPKPRYLGKGVTILHRPPKPAPLLCRKLWYDLRKAGGKMSATTPENVIIRAIHEAFIKYPEADGGQNLDYQWVQPEQSLHVAKAILLELAANGFEVVKKDA